MMAVLLFSCSSQRNLAIQFVTQQAQLHVLLLPPPAVIRKFYPAHPDSLKPAQVDPFNLSESQFIKHANDSVLINLFMDALRENLALFGVKAYEASEIEKFLALDSLAYVFSVAQLEAMEYNDKDLKYTLYDTTVYEIAFPQVILTQSQWFEFTELNHPERPMQVLYSSQFTNDVFQGRFRKNTLTGQMAYEYQSFPLGFADLYQLSVFAGQKNAQYIYDFLLNKYIDDRLKKTRRPKDYLQYQRELNTLGRAYNDRFIRIAIPDSE